MSIVCEAHGIEEHNCGSYGISISLYRNSQGLCGNCGERPYVTLWVDPNHPHEGWCERCVLSAQVEHARERAAALPSLEARLSKLLSEEGKRG